MLKVKRQYVQILNITDTSINRPILGQSTLMPKRCMFDKVDTVLSLLKSIDRLLISWGIFQGKRK